MNFLLWREQKSPQISLFPKPQQHFSKSQEARFSLLNDFIYDYKIDMGTTNPDKIKLVNMGLSINLVNKLEDDEQLQNITYDDYGNLIRNENINAYIDSQDEYTKFKFEKVFY